MEEINYQDLKDSFDQDIGFIIEDDGYINQDPGVDSFANPGPIEDYFEIRIERRDLDDKGNYELIVIKLDSFMTSKKYIEVVFSELTHKYDMPDEFYLQLNSCFRHNGDLAVDDFVDSKNEDFSSKHDFLKSMLLNDGYSPQFKEDFERILNSCIDENDQLCGGRHEIEVGRFNSDIKGLKSAVKCYLDNNGTEVSITMFGGYQI